MKNYLPQYIILCLITLFTVGYVIADEWMGDNRIGATAEFNDKVDYLKDKIEIIQESGKTNKYKQVLRQIDNDTQLDYEIHEYVTPAGEIGYVLNVYDENGVLVESVGYGAEAESRTKIYEYPVIEEIDEEPVNFVTEEEPVVEPVAPPAPEPPEPITPTTT